jgi:hypothetical protein
MSNCANPGTETKVVVRDEIRAECSLTHCDDGYVVLNVQFKPRNIGSKVIVQGHFHYEGKRGSEPATRRVTFYDDGSVVGFGNLANGVRFRLKPWFRDARHKTIIDSYCG